jgi:membrane fusion protein (multidrug efflux system)
MPIRRLFTAVLVLGICGLLSACAKGDDAAKNADQPVTVTTARLQPVRWADELTALGTANARESITVTASVGQTVREVQFDSGQFVKRGQPLVTLTEGQQSADVAAAQAELRDSQQQFERSRQLADQQLVARVTLDSQRATVDAAHARLASLQAQASDHVIRAPFDGVLGMRLVSAGSLVSPGTPITTLDDVSLIKLDFTFPESQLSQLAVGQSVNARSEAWPDDVFTGKIVTLDSRVDPGSRAITARAEIPNPDGKLRPGMLLAVGVERSARTTLAIPELALMQSAMDTSVYRVDGDKAVQVPVKIGSRRRGEVEIVSGLKAGDRIVVEGTVKLRDGSTIAEAPRGNAKPVAVPAPTPATASMPSSSAAAGGR